MIPSDWSDMHPKWLVFLHQKKTKWPGAAKRVRALRSSRDGDRCWANTQGAQPNLNGAPRSIAFRCLVSGLTMVYGRFITIVNGVTWGL